MFPWRHAAQLLGGGSPCSDIGDVLVRGKYAPEVSQPDLWVDVPVSLVWLVLGSGCGPGAAMGSGGSGAQTRGAGSGAHNEQMGFPSGTVTLLFTDVEGSIRLWEADREAMAEASARHDRIVRQQVEGAGGQVFTTAGEAFRAVFADPSAALASAVAIQRAVGTEPWPPGLPIRVRMALHSGACVERDGDYVGPVVNRTAQLLATGHGGQILVSGAAYELLADRLRGGLELRDLGEHRLKDLGRAERVFQVTGPGLAGNFGPLRTLEDPALRHNLPSQPTSFVGRAAELAELRSLVSGGSRLVTIVGPGGIGKSRLAVQVAADTLDGAGDGVWLAELAPVADPDLVAHTVATVLGVREEPGRPMLDTLVDAVGDRWLLVVLDNAEHVLGAAAKLADAMMRCCPRACLLVTSREPLGTGGEHVFRVPPLAVPPADLAAPELLAAFESVQLFTEHAARHRQGFALDEANAAAVAAVCARLDGIPLALELAAARLGSLSVTEISSRLDQRFRLLTGGSRTVLPRHQTLRALIDWSYDLLNPQEQVVLDRLSVFAGGWTLQAAEAVTARDGTEDWQVLDQLAALAGKSLVHADENQGSTRYRLLETVRHYAAEHLAQRAGTELDDTRAAHRDHYLDLVETADTYLRGPDEAVWLDRLEIEFDNIRVSLAYSVADPSDAEPGLRLASGLRWFSYMRGHGSEVLEALNVLLERPDARRPTRARARALTVSCHLLNQFGDNPAFPSLAGEAIKIAHDINDDATAADALSQLCWFRYEHGDLAAALADIDEAVGLARATGDLRLIAEVLGRCAVFKGEADDLDAAFADLEETLTLSRAAGDNYRLATALANLGVREFTVGQRREARAHLQEASMLADNHGYQNLSTGMRENLGFVELVDGDSRHARRLFLDSLDTARLTGVKPYVLGALLGLALAAGADSDPTVAAILHGVADERHEQAGQVCDAIEAGLRDRDHAQLRATLGDADFEAAYRHGRTLSQADAIALATTAAQPDPRAETVLDVPTVSQAPTDGAVDPLSDREREIVALLAGGATDARIAAHLYLSTNTVRSHLERIRDKTGARRRTDLVRYAIQAGIDPVPLPPEHRHLPGPT
jgi:predicted ATPase/class 3 adenylate cyclase/DNA-binding CsgD family transcriptional regulator/tetratricopeptide (TPR) repeat protein